MKKLIVMIAVLSMMFLSTAYAEDTWSSSIYEVDLSIDGSMSARNGTSTFLVNGSTAPLDLSKVKPNLGVWSLQVYEITPGAITAGWVSGWKTSGVTYTIDYSTSNNFGTWSSGTTTIGSATSLSGQTTEVIPFTPEFAKYYRFRVTAGITQFGSFKAKVIIQ